MTIYYVSKEFWNDNCDGKPYWVKERGETVVIDSNDEEIRRYVDQLNKEYIDEAIEGKNKFIEERRALLAKDTARADALARLNPEDMEALGIHAGTIGFSIEGHKHCIDGLTKDIERIKNTPFVPYDHGWTVAVKQRYVFEEIKPVKLVTVTKNGEEILTIENEGGDVCDDEDMGY